MHLIYNRLLLEFHFVVHLFGTKPCNGQWNALTLHHKPNRNVRPAPFRAKPNQYHKTMLTYQTIKRKNPRNGNVGFIKVGAFVDKGEFEGKVSTFLSPDYDGKPLASEEAVSFTPYFMGASVLGILLLIVGRWLLCRKAGKKGWHSLIPFLNSFEEYSLCWNGWLGVLADVIAVAGFWIITPVPHYLLMEAGLALGIVESVRLAKAFGKSTVLGVLMGLPVIRGIGRIVLGASKAAYTGAAKA